MSDIVEKTLSSLPKLLSENLLGGITGVAASSFGVSRGLHSLIRSVDCAKSRAKEEQIIRKELSLLHHRLSQPNASPMRDYLTRLVFCNMLGYDVSFGHIHAVKLAQQGTGWEKWIGYLTCCLLLHEDHELVVLLINTIQKDIKSTNLLDNNIALVAVCQLVNTEMIPLLLPLVEEKLKHSRDKEARAAMEFSHELILPEVYQLTDKSDYLRPLVRRKAVAALFCFWRKAPNMVQHIHSRFRAALCDPEPSVVRVALHIYQELIKENACDYSDLGTSFLNILEQILKRKFPAEYDYHSIPAPWLQITVLQILASLGANDKLIQAQKQSLGDFLVYQHEQKRSCELKQWLQESIREISSQMYPVLKEVLERSNLKENMAFAITYQCILTISSICPNTALLVEASHSIGKFLRSSNQNLKYIGVKALTNLVRVAPEFAVDYQMVVVECLENPDSSIQRKTLELLYEMANPSNVAVICQHLLNYISKTHDQFWQADIVSKLSSLVDSDPRWYVDTINKLLEVNQGDVPVKIIQKLLDIIEKGSEDREFVKYLIASYLQYLQKDYLPDALIQASVWVLGKFLSDPHDITEDRLISLYLKHFFGDHESSTREWILTSVTKLFICGVIRVEKVKIFVNEMTKANLPAETRQKLRELKNMAELQIRFPDSPFVNIKFEEMDFTLSFLDDCVSEALERGLPLNIPWHSRHPVGKLEEHRSLFAGIQYDAYQTPSGSAISNSAGVVSAQEGTGNGSDGYIDWKKESREVIGLNMKGVRKVWGRQGIIEEEKGLLRTRVSSHDQHADLEDMKSGHYHMMSENESQAEQQQQQNELVKVLFVGHHPTSLSLQGWKENQDSAGRSVPLQPSCHISDNDDWRMIHRRERSRDKRVIYSKDTISDIKNSTSCAVDQMLKGKETSSFTEYFPNAEHYEEVDVLEIESDKSISHTYLFSNNELTDSNKPDFNLEDLDCMQVNSDRIEVKCNDSVELKSKAAQFRSLGDSEIHCITSNPVKEPQPNLENFLPVLENEALILRMYKQLQEDHLSLMLVLNIKNFEIIAQYYLEILHSPDVRTTIHEITGAVFHQQSNTKTVINVQNQCCKTKLHLMPLRIEESIQHIDGVLRIQDNNGTDCSSHKFRVNIDLLDFLRSTEVSLEVFASTWPHLRHSKKLAFRTEQKKHIQQTFSQLLSQIKCHCVDKRGAEILLSGSYLHLASYMMHVKKTDSSEIFVVVKSDSSQLLDALIANIHL